MVDYLEIDVSDEIDISGMDKAEVLAALYNDSKPLGLGFIDFDPQPMSADEARTILDSGQTYFDYLKGRVMKVDLSGASLNPWLYDRDNGHGAAARALSGVPVDVQAE